VNTGFTKRGGTSMLKSEGPEPTFALAAEHRGTAWVTMRLTISVNTRLRMRWRAKMLS
jgi:hypothetical protein